MSDEQDTPVWHAIVGEGWRPVQFGEQTSNDDEVLRACAWAKADYAVSVSYRPDMMPRRRREASWEILMIKDGANYCRVKGVKPGEYFMVNEYGELILIDKPQTESAE
jgi:hypothetical protein